MLWMRFTVRRSELSFGCKIDWIEFFLFRQEYHFWLLEFDWFGVGCTKNIWEWVLKISTFWNRSISQMIIANITQRSFGIFFNWERHYFGKEESLRIFFKGLKVDYDEKNRVSLRFFSRMRKKYFFYHFQCKMIRKYYL